MDFFGLLDSALPALLDTTERDGSTTASLALKPKRVVVWAAFATDLQAFREQLVPKPGVFPAPRQDEDGCYVCPTEHMLQAAIVYTVCKSIDNLCDGDVGLKLWAHYSNILPHPPAHGSAIPDLVGVRLLPDNLPKSKRLVLVGEVKLRNLLGRINPNPDLVSRKRSAVVRHAFEQTTGYLAYNRLQYGFLTTYHFTWPLMLDSQGVLHVAAAHAADTAGTMSTLNALYYLIHLATTPDAGYRSPFKTLKAPVKPGKKVQKSSSSTAKRTRKTPQKESEQPRYVKAGLMAKKNGTSVWRCVDTHENNYVAFKCFEIQNAYEAEVTAYEALYPLKITPKLLEHGVLKREGEWAKESWKRYYIVVELVEKGESELDKDRLLDVLRKVHKAGFVHGDIRPNNVIVCKDGSIVLIDWESSEPAYPEGIEDDLEGCEYMTYN